MNMAKDFPALAVLSISSGRLLTIPRDAKEGSGICQIYEVLEWMTGQVVFTYKMPQLVKECKSWIHQFHPEIIEVDAEIVRRYEAGEVKSVQQEMLARFGDTITLKKIPN